MNYKSVLAVALITSITGCAAMGMGKKTPDFFPNEQLRRVGYSQADADARECMSLADQYVQQPNKAGTVAKDALIGGAAGAAVGAVGGTIMTPKVGRATAGGAAIGGMLGLAKGLYDMNETSPSYERFVEYCLQKKGYEITGWSSK